jgi:hypothetical protein
LPASVIKPSTSVTFGAVRRHSSMNGCLASFGMKTSHFMPAAAAYAAAALPAFAGGRQEHGLGAKRLGARDRG